MIDEVEALVIEVAGEVSEEQGIDPMIEIAAESRLFGEGGHFDSMGLVSLIIAVEQAIEEKFGKRVALADEKALSQKSSPYRTVSTLAKYAHDQF